MSFTHSCLFRAGTLCNPGRTTRKTVAIVRLCAIFLLLQGLFFSLAQGKSVHETTTGESTVFLITPPPEGAGAFGTPNRPENTARNERSNPHVVIVGGHASHDFDRWFDQESRVTLSESVSGITYTDNPDTLIPLLDKADLLMLSNNQPLSGDSLRQRIFDFVREGNGLLLVHAALWYNWEDWPEYNRYLAGGGSRSHPPFGNFEVTLVNPEHPVTAHIPDRFFIHDELYRFHPDDQNPPMLVLAEATEEETGITYPVVWTMQYGHGRIVCITLGHDGQAHTHPAFRRLIQNSVHWLSSPTP